MATILHLKRPEKSPWEFVWLIAALAAAVWIFMDRSCAKSPIVSFALIVVLISWFVRMYRWRKTPDLSIEIDDRELRLLPAEHWPVDRVPLDAIKSTREEMTSLWIYYFRSGEEKALELRSSLFERNEWAELVGRLRRGENVEFPNDEWSVLKSGEMGWGREVRWDWRDRSGGQECPPS